MGLNELNVVRPGCHFTNEVVLLEATHHVASRHAESDFFVEISHQRVATTGVGGEGSYGSGTGSEHKQLVLRWLVCDVLIVFVFLCVYFFFVFTAGIGFFNGSDLLRLGFLFGFLCCLFFCSLFFRIFEFAVGGLSFSFFVLHFLVSFGYGFCSFLCVFGVFDLFFLQYFGAPCFIVVDKTLPFEVRNLWRALVVWIRLVDIVIRIGALVVL
mmetsp:Transcript_22621/g.47924  ORF Transcript_22621/g.47924 Transcript_22621/m.47924 type:complete len:212 (+) Transcript_22621:3060-3695(+)